MAPQNRPGLWELIANPLEGVNTLRSRFQTLHWLQADLVTNQTFRFCFGAAAGLEPATSSPQDSSVIYIPVVSEGSIQLSYAAKPFIPECAAAIVRRVLPLLCGLA